MKYSYKVKGVDISLSVDNEYLGVRFKERIKRSGRASMSRRVSELKAFSKRKEIPKEKFTILSVNVPSSEKVLEKVNVRLEAMNDVVRTSPVFKVGKNSVMTTDKIMVGFSMSEKAMEIIESVDGTVIEKKDDEYLIQLPENIDPFTVVNKLDEKKEVDYAEPDFVMFGKHVPRVSQPQHISHRPDYSELQYALKLTGATEAWGYQKGSSIIKIAILDEGVDTAHEDLTSSVVGSYDGTDNDEFQEPLATDAHGTACAGLAAAVSNDIGVNGTGAGCSILAVRIAFSDRNGNWETKNSWITRSIDWSWKNGADILSNSWGGGAPSNAIINAFERARTKGRNGKGSLIVVAAGNEFGQVSFPGSLSQVLTVSASNEYDEPKTPYSQDGEHWWGSNFGSEIDISAPGVHNYTTDISGDDGYNDGTYGVDPDYVENFNGTSSSTPIVAGCAGLLLSANTNLTEKELREIICETADKVGSVNYNNGHNEHMGFGRINVLKAILKIK